jgi:hypothetical protein
MFKRRYSRPNWTLAPRITNAISEVDEHTDSKGREFGEMTAALREEFASSSLLPQRVPASRLLLGGARRAQGNDQDAVQKIDALTIGIERETQHPPRNE